MKALFVIKSVGKTYLRTPSRVKLTISITPPAGWVRTPRSPFPIPLKNPSIPSERAPNKKGRKCYQANSITKTS